MFFLNLPFLQAGAHGLELDTIAPVFNKRHSVNAHYHFGRVIPHTSRFLPEVTSSSQIVDIGFSKQLMSQGKAISIFGDPMVGMVVQFGLLGDSDVFGNSVGIFPFAGFVSNLNNHFSIIWQLGGGIAYLSNKYDPFENSINNVIGSNINNVTQGKFALQWNSSRYWQFSGGAAFTHFSNGSARSPNLGINLGTFHLGANYTFSNATQELNSESEIIKIDFKKHGAFYRAGFGVKDRGIGSPRHPIITHTLAYVYATGSFNNIWLGGTYAFNRSELQALRLTEQDGSNVKRHMASDASLFVANEWIFGRVGLYGMVGYYVYDPAYNDAAIYFKLGIQYYPIKTIGRQRVFIFSNIKSHRTVADYFEFGLGYRI